MEGLEDDADGIATKSGKGIFMFVFERSARDFKGAGGGALEAGDEHEQGGLAGSRGANDADGFAGVHTEVNTFENFHVAGAAGKGEGYVFQENGGLGHGPTNGRWLTICRVSSS